MAQNIFSLDGIYYNLFVTKLERDGQVTDTEASGRVNDYSMYRDIIGTFYNYNLTIYPYSDDDADDYDTFYNEITAPVPSHTLVVPYGQETLTFEAYVTKAKDTLVVRNGKNIWGSEGLSLSFIAMEPQRRRN